jgi:EmrB/QacA subfamily drug resistance transporter
MSNALHAPTDTTTARIAEEARSPSHPRIVVATTILASSLAFIDSSVVNVGLPAIGRTFHADPTGLQWIINAYLLPLSALLFLGGAVGDRFGRRRVLIAGALLFCVASLACAVAPTLVLLLVARFVQGASAAMLMPNSLAILGQSFSGEAKGRAIGIWAAAGAAAAAVGPLLGGWLIDQASWRLAFLINVPLSLATTLLASRYIDDDVDKNADSLDWLGGALITAALGLTTWALTDASVRAWSPSTLTAFGAGILVWLLFVFAQRRLGGAAMMPLSLFASRSFVGLTLLTFLVYGALGGMFVLVPFVLMQAGEYSAAQAGAALLPLPLVVAVASPAAGALTTRVGRRSLLIVGPAIVAGGLFLMMRIGEDSGYWFGVLPGMLVVALGMACAVAPLTTAVLMTVDRVHTGTASGLNSAVARTGGLVATALIGPVLAASGPDLLHAFRLAAAIGAAICFVAAASAAMLIAPAEAKRFRSTF